MYKRQVLFLLFCEKNMNSRELNPNISNIKESQIPFQSYIIKSALMLSLLTISPVNQAWMQSKKEILNTEIIMPPETLENIKEAERPVIMQWIIQAISDVHSMNDLPRKIIYPQWTNEKYHDLPTRIDVNPKILDLSLIHI